MTKGKLSRRNFLKGTALAAGGTLGSGLLGSLSSLAQSNGDPIKVGAMYLLSGGLATYGEFAREGVELAIDEINEMGGINGREVEAIFEHETNASGVIQVAQRLVLEENVDFLLGIDSSGTAEALVPFIPELERILMITHAASPKVTGELCNPYVFRCSVNVPQNMKAAASLAADQGYKRWTTIGPDYAFGHQSWEYFEKYLSELDEEAEFMDPFFPAFASEEYSSFITALQDAGPEAILCSLWGNDLVNFIRQAKPLGLFDEIPVFMTLGAAMEVLEALGDEMPEGLFVGTRYWWDMEEGSEVNDEFVSAFMDRFEHPPSYNAQNGYVGMKLLAQAVETAGTTETDAVIEALEGLEYEAPMGELTIRPEDHQAVIGVTWGQTAASEDYAFRILDPTYTFEAEEVTRPVEDTGCEM